jgi:DNA segregation ATPase FtsK/SpoIIIE-like protein
MNNFASDEYIASLFYKFIQNATTFNDERVMISAKTLLSLSHLIKETSGNGLVHLFGVLIDQTRVFLGRASEKEVTSYYEEQFSNVDDLVNSLLEDGSLSKQENIMFAIKYGLLLATKLPIKDQFATCFGLQLITSIVKLTSPRIESNTLTNIVKAIFLIPMTTETLVQEFASECNKALIMIANEESPIDHSAFDISSAPIRFVDDYRTLFGHWKRIPIRCLEKQCFPEVFLFKSFEGNTPEIINMLSALLTERAPPVDDEEEEEEEEHEQKPQSIPEAPQQQQEYEEEEEEKQEHDNEPEAEPEVVLPPPQPQQHEEEEEEKQEHDEPEAESEVVLPPPQPQQHEEEEEKQEHDDEPEAEPEVVLNPPQPQQHEEEEEDLEELLKRACEEEDESQEESAKEESPIQQCAEIPENENLQTETTVNDQSSENSDSDLVLSDDSEDEVFTN